MGLFLVAAMTLAAAGCGNTGSNTDSEKNESEQQMEEVVEEKEAMESVEELEDVIEEESDLEDEEEEAEELPVESSLKGTGPASAVADASSTDAGQSDLKNGDVLVDLNFDTNDLSGFTSYTNGGSCELKAKDARIKELEEQLQAIKKISEYLPN